MSDQKILAVRECEGASVVTCLVDSIYENNWDQFETEILGIVGAVGSGTLILDLSPITFLSSFALGIIIRADRQAREQEGCLCFVSLTDPVKRLFRIAVMDKEFKIFDSVDEALAALK